MRIKITKYIAILLSLLLFVAPLLLVETEAAEGQTTIVIKAPGGTDGIGRISKGSGQLVILSQAIPAPGKVLTGYNWDGTQMFNASGKFQGGSWNYNDDTMTVTISTKEATQRCTKCFKEMPYKSHDGTVCQWQHPESECENSNTVQATSHSWVEGNCAIKPYCKICHAEKPNSSTNSNHAHIDTYPGTCSSVGGVIPHKHCPACNTYFSMEGNVLANGNAVKRNTAGCTWGNAKWEWSVDDNYLASYKLSLECTNCGRKITHEPDNKIRPAQNAKTIAPTCTAEGVNYYTATATYDGQSFTSEHTVTVPATKHSFEGSEKLNWKVKVDALNKQYHYLECHNKLCPDGGIVLAGNCEATGKNVATCETQSICDTCGNVFGDTMQHEWDKGVCKNCEKKHDPHEWKEEQGDTCNICGYVHEEHDWFMGKCSGCAYIHDPHEWENGVCKVCEFMSDEHEWENGVCKECGAEHYGHTWENGKCTVCFVEHDHGYWQNGVCSLCKFEHQDHDWKDGKCQICKYVHEVHDYKDSKCNTCGVVCKHLNKKDGNCEECGLVDYTYYIGSELNYALDSKGQILLKVNGPVNRFKNLTIDGFPVDMQYLSVKTGTITINSSFLNRLSVGEHDVVVNYDNGKIEAKIAILDSVKEEKSGMSTFWMIFWIILIVVILVVVGAVVVWFKIREEYEYDDDEDDTPPPPTKKTIAQTAVDQKAYQAALDDQRRQRAQMNPTRPTQPISRPQQPSNNPEDDEVMKGIEREIGMNVSQFLDEDEDDDD